MKCERCHQADANTVIHVKQDGEMRELFVCKACAKAEQTGRTRNAPSAGARPTGEIKIDGDGEPPAFVKNLLEATLGFMQGVAETEKNARVKCPGCRQTWDEIKEAGRLGCPACWTAFAADIRRTFLASAYAPVHVGDRPPDVRGGDSREQLERQLKAAVAREDFKTAARLKRQLDALAQTDGADR